jgi:HSP20 family protein
MTRVRIHPDATAFTLHEAMEQLLDRGESAAGSNGRERALRTVPRADAWEDDDSVTIEMAVPGVVPGSVNVTYERGLLTVSGEVPQRDDARSWVLAERARGAFERRFRLRVPIDAERAEARVDNGVVVLTLPKREEVKARRIAVVAE